MERSVNQKIFRVEGGSMDNMRRISAIAWAARQAGERYGSFQAKLTPKERERVYRAYEAGRNIAMAERRGKSVAEVEEENRRRAELPPLRARYGGRGYSFDTVAAFRLYREGYTDREIGQELGMSAGAIRNWRNRQGLKALGRR